MKSHSYILSTLFIALLVLGSAHVLTGQSLPVPTTINDFFLPGSQPLESGTFTNPDQCDNCHGGYDQAAEPAFNWRGSMMAHAQRDPLYLACLAVANQDAVDVGDLCIRCHTPKGWLEGRSEPTNGSLLTADDRESITCHFCHKMIVPFEPPANPYPDHTDYNTQPGNNPSAYEVDLAYMSILTNIPVSSANGMYVVDDQDNRRGPYFDPQNNHSGQTPISPFHSESAMCATCHDVSNPVFTAVRDGEGNITGYVPNEMDTPFGSDFNRYDMFPVERTYSEWSMSEYNTSSGVSGTFFGGNKESVSTCQDCHMRDVTGKGADKSYAPVRDDLPLHDMTGGNTFIPDLLETLWPGDGIDGAALAAGKARALDMLQHAASLDVTVDQLGATVSVTVTNETGHKLPSGYPEGRRMWINLVASNSISGETYESGHYDLETAELTTEGTKIYHVKPGLSDNMAAISGLEAGPSFHFVLCDKIYFDNRIPPRGFTNENFEAIQSPPVNYTYVDGQYWDDTSYELPFIPDQVQVTLYYQTASKEYVEFLRDENYTNDAGEIMYSLWEQNGKSEPVVMNQSVWTGPPVEPTSTLQLTAFLEGAYSGGTMQTILNDQGALPLVQPFDAAPWYYTGSETVTGIPSPDIVDWLLLELRETDGTAADATGATIVAQKAVFLKSDGSVVDLDGSSLPEFDHFPAHDLYAVIWHRNHLGVMSSAPLVRTDGIYGYDFSTGPGQAHGGAGGYKDLGDGTWGLVAADANADGVIDDTDRSGSWMLQAGLAGYRSGDFNMDSQVNNPDKNNFLLENSLYICHVPE